MQPKLRFTFLLVTAFGCLASVLFAEPAIYHDAHASFSEKLAAKEIRRYVYLRMGRRLPIHVANQATVNQIEGIVVGRKDRPTIRRLALMAGLEAEVARLHYYHYLLETVDCGERRILMVCGGDDIGTLYAAYRLAEHLGVRFYLHGDVIPDQNLDFEVPVIGSRQIPLFNLRGIQPFHDFPEGPDWWNLDEYKMILSQLPKMGMNFFGLHTYPEGPVGPEPTVWIGKEESVNADGTVKASYPSRHFTTHSGTWGYQKKDTSSYHCGAAELFTHDAYGPEYMIGHTPWPESPEACNEIFNDFGQWLGEAFDYAHKLGIRTCVGTETPLTIPTVVKERWGIEKKDVIDKEARKAFYRGLFRRIMRTYAIDYYWFWTPETWTWHKVTKEQVQQTLDDIKSAIAAADEIQAAFTLATCGWVLGPPQDRALFDNELPEEMPMSCINRMVGKEPVEPGFRKIAGRPKWAIPWLEDDPALTSPQLWAGRMRRDAFDALRYGCTGLMGIHWRTRILGPQARALALAAWDQTGWSSDARAKVDQRCMNGVLGGTAVAYSQPIEGTDNDPVYQSVRYNLSGYHVAVPNGSYTVTLKFCEPHYDEKGRRVFGAEVQGMQVIDQLDLIAKVGKNYAYDVQVDNVKVDEGYVEITFTPQVEFPLIAGIVVEGDGVSKKINCGGQAYGDFSADLQSCPTLPRDLPTEDFYGDWADYHFGKDAGPSIAKIFNRLDGQLPVPSGWINGPGGIQPDPRPWKEVSPEYAFVDELAALRPLVKGKGNRSRFDYWLNSFRYMKTMARINCTWSNYNNAVAEVQSAEDEEEKEWLLRREVLPLRRVLVGLVEKMYGHLLATVSTTGAIGNVSNWEQHLLPDLLEKPGKELEKILGEPLPDDAILRHEYRGPLHVIVPVVRTSLKADESLRLKVYVLSESKLQEMALFWRPMNRGEFERVALEHVERGVYEVELSGKMIGEEDFEYYVKVTNVDGEQKLFPVTAPRQAQTVVVWPGE
jgi:hypothetical protein